MFFDFALKVMYFLIIIIIYYGLFYEKMHFFRISAVMGCLFLEKKTPKYLLN